MKTTFCGIILLFFTGMFAVAAEVQTTVSQGIGSSADAALKDALNQAVQQVVGSLVNSETLVKNDKLIKEEILTHSNGYVKKYHVLKKVHPISNGMYSVTIKAEVVEQTLKERLNNINVTQVTLDDMHNIWAQIESQNSRKDSAEYFLIKTLNKLKKTDFLQPILVDKNGNRGHRAVPSIIPTEDNSKVIFSIGAIIKFNHKKFVTEIQQILRKTLERLCKDKSKYIKLSNVPKSYGFNVNDEGMLTVSYDKHNMKIFCGKYFNRQLHSIYIPQKLNKKWLSIALNQSKSYNQKEQYFIRYYFPKTKKLTKFMDGKVTKHCCLTLLLKDENDKILKQYKREIFAGYHDGNPMFHDYSGAGYGISPEFKINYIFSGCQLEVIKFEMNTSDVKNIKSIHLFVSEAEK